MAIAPAVGKDCVGALRLVAVIGPPAVGKSTVTGLAATAYGAHVFRLREFADRYQVDHPELDHLFETADPLGWFRDDTVRMLLYAALEVPPRADTVLLENLPGNAIQLHYLIELSCAAGHELAVVELAAPDDLLTVRASTRRVCPSCEPDPHGDPHRPAHGLATAPDDCDRCGGRLMSRKSDEFHRFEARLRHFRRNCPQIRTAAAAARVPYRVVDTTDNVTSVSTAFLAACRSYPAAVL